MPVRSYPSTSLPGTFGSGRAKDRLNVPPADRIYERRRERTSFVRLALFTFDCVEALDAKTQKCGNEASTQGDLFEGS
jgi:hypothetical protein